MPQSFSKVYLHIIFSTKFRKPIVTSAFQSILHSYIVSLGANLGTFTEEIYANPDHIHWLCTLPRTLTIAELVQKVKISSSNKMAELGIKEFSWQKGYAAFSVSQSKLSVVKRYIQNQEEHHKKVSFQEEYLKFLGENGLEHDDKYVWD